MQDSESFLHCIIILNCLIIVTINNTFYYVKIIWLMSYFEIGWFHYKDGNNRSKVDTQLNKIVTVCI